MISKIRELITRTKTIIYIYDGKDLLQKNGITSNMLEEAGVISEQQKNNFYLAMGEGIISPHIIFDISKQLRFSKSQLAVMLSENGLEALRKDELAADDFSLEFIEDNLAEEEMIAQLKSLKHIELDFYRGAVDDIKAKAISFSKAKTSAISNPYRSFLFQPEEKTKKQSPEVKKSTQRSTDLLAKGQLAWSAIRYAQRYRKKGHTELENNRRTAKEYATLRICIEEQRQYIRDIEDKSIKLLKERGFVTEENRRDLKTAAGLHYEIEASKSSFLANCHEMAILILDYLNEIGYKKPAYLAHIGGGDHAFVIVETDEGPQTWDPWANKAYWYNDENVKKHLQNFVFATTSQGKSRHRLEDYSFFHKIVIDESRSLENLQLFRRLAKDAGILCEEPQATSASDSDSSEIASDSSLSSGMKRG